MTLMKRNLLYQFGVSFILLILVSSACSFLPSGGGDAPEEASPPTVAVTETQVPTPKSSPTITPTPTITPIPTEALTSTTRPTWTPFPSKTLRPTWTASPTLSPTATKDIGWIIKEDFSDPEASWLKKKG